MDTDTCDRCGRFAENACHVLQGCLKAKHVWEFFPNFVEERKVSRTGCKEIFVTWKISIRMAVKYLNILFGVIVWMILKDRNLEVIVKKENPVSQTLFKINAFACDLTSAFWQDGKQRKTREERIVQWKIPREGWHKINTC